MKKDIIKVKATTNYYHFIGILFTPPFCCPFGAHNVFRACFIPRHRERFSLNKNRWQCLGMIIMQILHDFTRGRLNTLNDTHSEIILNQKPKISVDTLHISTYIFVKSSLLFTQKLVCFFTFKIYFYHSLQNQENKFAFYPKSDLLFHVQNLLLSFPAKSRN